MIEPRYTTLNRLFVDRVFRIPKYQRFYSWQRKQRDDLFGDLRTLADKGEDRDHFMATVVCFRTTEVKPVGATDYRVYDIVDGQQRITTLVILLKAIEKRLQDGDDKRDLARLLVKQDGNLLVLQTNNANQHLFNRYLTTGKEPVASEVKTHADRNVRAAIHECEVFLNEWLDEGRDTLSLLRLLRNRLGFVAYDTDDSRIVYSVFEVLNSRGLAVDWLDKCKSALMGRAFDLSQTADAGAAKVDELHALWGVIYQELATFPVRGEEVLRVAATIYLGDEAGKPTKPDTALERLRECCSTPGKTVEVSQWILGVAQKLVELQKNRYWDPVTGILQARVLAVALMLTDTLVGKERDKALDQWERVTFRVYGLFGKDSRSKVGDYVRLAKNVMNKATGAARYSEIMDSLRYLGADYPIDRAVTEGLEGKNCYDDPEETRYMLWRFEEHLAAEQGAEVNRELRETVWEARSAAESIEHIMPQSPEPGGAWDGKLPAGDRVETWVHRIGNLLLLPQPLNEEARRQGFAAKKNIYARSEGLRIVKQVMEKSDWTHQEIVEREARITAWAKTAWADRAD